MLAVKVSCAKFILLRSGITFAVTHNGAARTSLCPGQLHDVVVSC
jgi:hypothetical protein